MPQYRVKPTMVSRKWLALDFIKRYFAQWGGAPSLGEIAAALHISRQRAQDLVRQLSDEEQLRHAPGKQRGLWLPNPAEMMSQADAVLRLRSLGWVVDNDARVVAEPASPLTNPGLPSVPELDHDPQLDGDGVFSDGHGFGTSEGDARDRGTGAQAGAG